MGAVVPGQGSPGVEVAPGEPHARRDPVQQGERGRAVGHVQVGRAPGGLHPVDDPGDPQSGAGAAEQHVAGVEVPVQEAAPVRRGRAGDDVDRPLPEAGPAGARGPDDPLGGGPRLVGAGPLPGVHRQSVDTEQLPGQQAGAGLGVPVVQADRPRQQGHEERGMGAVAGRRVHRRERGRGHVRSGEEAQHGRLAGQQPLRVPDVEGLDEGAQDQGAAVAAGTAEVQAAHPGGPAAEQRDDLLDAFTLGQPPRHPGAGGVPVLPFQLPGRGLRRARQGLSSARRRRASPPVPSPGYRSAGCRR